MLSLILTWPYSQIIPNSQVIVKPFFQYRKVIVKSYSRQSLILKWSSKADFHVLLNYQVALKPCRWALDYNSQVTVLIRFHIVHVHVSEFFWRHADNKNNTWVKGKSHSVYFVQGIPSCPGIVLQKLCEFSVPRSVEFSQHCWFFRVLICRGNAAGFCWPSCGSLRSRPSIWF